MPGPTETSTSQPWSASHSMHAMQKWVGMSATSFSHPLCLDMSVNCMAFQTSVSHRTPLARSPTHTPRACHIVQTPGHTSHAVQ
jgi:hypothetical protein